MANIATKLRLPGIKETQWQVLAGPVLIMTILAMMILPLPTFVLDLLFTFNIVLAIMILLVAMFTQNTLEFSAFPTVLLFSTLLRLALNVASTRVILMHGHNGADAAGQVIEAFGHFLVGGNFAIGIVVFIILIIINFMVITKGAGRGGGQTPSKRGDSGGRFLRLHGRCEQICAWRCHRRPADHGNKHYRWPDYRRNAA